MTLEVAQYSAATLWIIAALLWISNQIRIRKAITELNREVRRLKESENEQSNAGKVLFEKTTVNERAASPLAADVGRSVRPDSKHNRQV